MTTYFTSSSLPSLFLSPAAISSPPKRALFSCETVDFPVMFALAMFAKAVPLGDPRHVLAPHLVTEPSLPIEAFNAVAEFVRATDAPDAYHMGNTFVRGKHDPSARSEWRPKLAVLNQVDMVCRRFHLKGWQARKTVQAVFLALYQRRELGLYRSPANPQQSLVAFCAQETGGVHIFDISPSLDPPRQSFADPAPPPYRHHLVVDVCPLNDEYKRSCLRCSNRFLSKLRCCGDCRVARYCSPACQHADYATHKAEECTSLGEWRANVNLN